MSSRKQAWTAIYWLLIHAAYLFHSTAATSRGNEGDFAFDPNEDLKVEIFHSTMKECPVKRLWGVPDMPAYVGRVFKLQIPNEAFSGKISSFKADGVEAPLPKWLLFDGNKGILKGVPELKDRGEHRIKVIAIPNPNNNTKCSLVTDIFTIEVKDVKEIPTSGSDVMQQCHFKEDETQLKILIDRPMHKLSPELKLSAINNLANFLGLDYTAFLIQPYQASEKKPDNNFDVILSGLGDKLKKNSKATTEILVTVGCSGKLWPKHSILVHQFKEQARDGTISFVTHLPVISWKVVSLRPVLLVRKQRNTGEGSADYSLTDDDEEDYSGSDEEYGDYGNETDATGEDIASSSPSKHNINNEDNDEDFDSLKTMLPLLESDDLPDIPSSSLVPRKHNELFYESGPIGPGKTDDDNDDENDRDDPFTPVIPSSANNATQTTEDETFESLPFTTKESTTVDATTTDKPNTIIGRTTETIEFTKPANTPPQIQHRTKKVPVTAGKYFSYIIPEDLFYDVEDGTNLRLAMYDVEHNPLKSTSWVQFNPQAREVYGLPLEDHVSKWEYIMEATDSKGASVNDTLDITVQQHKGRRTVNHEFSMKLRVTKKYPSIVDWQIRILKGLVSLFRDTDMDQITVRNVVLDTDPIEFIWTNDTLPKNDCPKTDIDRLMGILQSSPDGDPSAALTSSMSPELNIKNVNWAGTGACQGPPSTPTASLPNHNDNFNPIPRNQIDQIRVEVGKFLFYKVPEDTFYDHEDGNARNLKMSLTKGDRSPIHHQNWLQFDSKNQEFYGLPLERDKGRKEYQLVCEDRGGLTASDALIVEVYPGNYSNPTVEFRMTIDTPYDSFVQNPAAKRKFVENLYKLFDDKDYMSIKIKSITDRPTIVSWYNTSLPTDRCPNEDIDRLKKVLTVDKSLTERVHEVMGNEFSVMSVSFSPTGACNVGAPIIPHEPPPVYHTPNEDATKSVSSDDYITTFVVPIVVIVCMIFVASLIACALYRRRRSGKMSVGGDEEKQPFRSRGIPVIFQDELDEKPDPSNKTPVIMKEEKPPLLPPPEYKGTDSGSPTPSHTPYHPPPPFTASRENNRNNRPKPTPTYRKPPPYVPP